MPGRAIVVLDVGKTHAKLTLWDRSGMQLDRRSRANAGQAESLDAAGIEGWMAEVLADFAAQADIGAIIPVAHGAAAAIIDGGALLAPPLDYEAFITADMRAAYDQLRAPFAETGSPALPDGLNLGVQLFRQSPLSETAQILPWPQYWSWLLSGVASSEVTSLGCHTDLWNPATGQPSSLAISQGWATRLAPLRRAGDVLGPITPAWAKRTGLPADTHIHCGVHDSNAALVAARGFPEIAGQEATVLSTGTWFIAMRTPAQPVDLTLLPEDRDCLVNVDVDGRPVPSARFMGGREMEMLGAVIDKPGCEGLAEVTANSVMVLPSFVAGCGPFPDCSGGWVNEPREPTQRRVAAALYAALVADTSLDLVGACGALLIEGRFARSEIFARALAALRPDMAIYTSDADADVSFGALRLVDPSIKPAGALQKQVPLRVDLITYKNLWHERIREGKAT